MGKYIGHHGIKKPKATLVRASNVIQAKRFTRGTEGGYQPYKATRVKKYGLAGGIPMYKVSFKRNYGMPKSKIKYIKKK